MLKFNANIEVNAKANIKCERAFRRIESRPCSPPPPTLFKNIIDITNKIATSPQDLLGITQLNLLSDTLGTMICDGKKKLLQFFFFSQN